MRLRILAFGIAQEAMGGREVELEVDRAALTVGQLKAILLKRYPQLDEQVSFLIAVNARYAYDRTRISSGDEIAVIPPTSGG